MPRLTRAASNSAEALLGDALDHCRKPSRWPSSPASSCNSRWRSWRSRARISWPRPTHAQSGGGGRQPPAPVGISLPSIPDRTISFGVRAERDGPADHSRTGMGIAKHDLEQARYEAANGAVRHGGAGGAGLDRLQRGAAGTGDWANAACPIVRLAYDNLGAAAGRLRRRSRWVGAQRAAGASRRDVVRATLRRPPRRGRTRRGAGYCRLARRLEHAKLRCHRCRPQDPGSRRRDRARRHGPTLGPAAPRTRPSKRACACLSHQRRFRWLNQLDIGVFRDQVVGGTSFTGPNMAIELPLFDQRQSQAAECRSELLRSELRRLQAARLAARSEIRTCRRGGGRRPAAGGAHRA